MKGGLSVKGIIPIALAFVIVLSVILVAVTAIFWSKTPLSVSRVKRYYALNYAMAALHEASFRFRTNYRDHNNHTWNADAWAAKTSIPADRFIQIEGMPVLISVVRTETPAGSGVWRNKVSATVNYEDVEP